LREFRKRWNIGQGAMDVAIYAHGGLTDEDSAADTAARWIPALYEAKIFPIFLMWETDLFSTLKNRLEDAIAGIPRPTAGLQEQLAKWWNERVERALAGPGSVIWDEMKQNARAISDDEKSGARLLYRIAQEEGAFQPKSVRIHLIGHSAGAIVHSYIVEKLTGAGWRFKTVNFMAPAVTVKTFKDTVLPRIRSGDIERYHQFQLTEEKEQQDPTCRPIVGYSRSLLYLVSESFEHGQQTPILGMEKYLASAIPKAMPNRIRSWAAPGAESSSTTHGDFDNDKATMMSIINLIRKGRP
jgi:hypothetical protein